jgi:hypothetical protein
MGLGLRIFLVNDDDSLQRLPLVRYERLWRRDPEERLPQYAGKRTRYAEVLVEFDERKPVAIWRIQYFFLTFDSQGRLDPAEQERESKLAIEGLPNYSTEEQPSGLIDARHRFARKRYKDAYRWTPKREIEEAIVDAIFGGGAS